MKYELSVNNLFSISFKRSSVFMGRSSSNGPTKTQLTSSFPEILDKLFLLVSPIINCFNSKISSRINSILVLNFEITLYTSFEFNSKINEYNIHYTTI